MKNLALVITVFLASPLLRAQTPSDGKEWAASGGKFDASKTLAELPAGYRFEHVMLPMRDGVGLATTVFLPPSGMVVQNISRASARRDPTRA